MQLISVDSATRTVTGGVLALSITADLADGNGVVSGIPYSWDQNLRDPYGLYPQIDEWMAGHPDFPIADYVPPIIAPEQVDAETNRRMTVVTADALMRLQVLGTPVPDSVKAAAQAIDARGAALKAMSPIPENFTDDAYWQ